MTKWQKERNYRIHEIRNEEGEIISRKFFITVDKVNVSVSEEIFNAYAQADRKERYQAEREAGRLLSLERMEDELNDSLLIHLGGGFIESAEDTAIREIYTLRMLEALNQLSPNERDLLTRIYFDDVPIREIAREQGVYHRTIAYRRDKALEKLRRLME